VSAARTVPMATISTALTSNATVSTASDAAATSRTSSDASTTSSRATAPTPAEVEGSTLERSGSSANTTQGPSSVSPAPKSGQRRRTLPLLTELTDDTGDAFQVARELASHPDVVRRLWEHACREDSPESASTVHARELPTTAVTSRRPPLDLVANLLQRALPACGLTSDAVSRAHAIASFLSVVRSHEGTSASVWTSHGGPVKSNGVTVVTEGVFLDTVIYALCFVKVICEPFVLLWRAQAVLYAEMCAAKLQSMKCVALILN
jgi:hypothetical protein